MSFCPDNPVLGRNLTDNFTFNEAAKQIVPKAGTDTKPGALALNLGNNLPGDTTNATDALTAAGFNAMAGAPDDTDPFCGNAIQQAVTVAVGQSIGCDAAAQEAIACAIASNPDAVACLAAALPSGIDLTGSALIHAFTPSTVSAVNLSDTGATQIATTTSATSPQTGSYNRFQNAGKFASPADSGITAFDTSTNTYSAAQNTLPGVQARWVVNHTGTAAATANIYGDNPGSYLHKLSAAGNTITDSRNITASGKASWLGIQFEYWFADDNFQGVNINTGAVGTVTGFPADGSVGVMSHDYTKFGTVRVFQSSNGPDVPTFRVIVKVYTVSRSGDDFTFTETATADYNDYDFYTGIGVIQGLTWSRDNSHLISCVHTSGGTPSIHRGISQVFNVNGSTIERDLGGVLAWGTTPNLFAPVVSLDGTYMLAIARETYDGGTKPRRDNVALFKRVGSKYFQIARMVGVQGMFVEGAGGARSIG